MTPGLWLPFQLRHSLPCWMLWLFPDGMDTLVWVPDESLNYSQSAAHLGWCQWGLGSIGFDKGRSRLSVFCLYWWDHAISPLVSAIPCLFLRSSWWLNSLCPHFSSGRRPDFLTSLLLNVLECPACASSNCPGCPAWILEFMGPDTPAFLCSLPWYFYLSHRVLLCDPISLIFITPSKIDSLLWLLTLLANQITVWL